MNGSVAEEGSSAEGLAAEPLAAEQLAPPPSRRKSVGDVQQKRGFGSASHLAGASSETRPGVSSSRCPQKSFPRRPNEVPTAKTSFLLHIAVRPLLNQY
ncbi:hypothetical protein [Eggerthella lenta]|uniref:hypothetical protein n=1 Tax=Eggerthella lenta TaxID=84112 RepID=UPI00189791FA|nr:hypothetical protein [Eggerthella lenta]